MTARPLTPGRLAAFAWVALAYVTAAVVALAVHRALGAQPPLVAVAAADLAATVFVFAFSRIFDNSSFYDPYWSVGPMLMAPALALCHAAPGVSTTRQLVVVGLVLVWGARLTWNWARGWRGLEHEDWRYVDLRAKTGRGYWAVSFLGLHLFPTVLVFLGCLPLWPALAHGTRPFGVLDVLATLVTGGAIALEARADRELRDFRLAPDSAGRILDTGVWAWSRHPNYLGEIGFWWGLVLFGLAAEPRGMLWRASGALAITALFVLISIPMLDRRSLARRPGYAEHMARVPALLPRFGRRA